MTTVNKKELYEALSAIKPTIQKSPIVPILEEMCLSFSQGKVSCRASNLQFFSKKKISFVGEPLVPFGINPKYLPIIKDMNGDINIEINGDSVSMICGKEKIKFYSEMANWPSEPKVEKWTTALIIDAKELVEILSNISPFLSTDDLRPSMTGVHFKKVIDGPIIIEGTNAHILTKLERETLLNNEFDFILRLNLPLMKELSGIVTIEVQNDYTERFVTKSFDGVETKVDESYTTKTTARLTDEKGMEIITRLIDEKYPQVDSAIPTENPIRCTVSMPEIIKSFTKGKDFTNQTTNKVEFKIKENSMEIYYEDIDYSREYTQEVSCQTVADPEKTKDPETKKIIITPRDPEIHIGVNWKMFKTSFGHIKGSAVLHMSLPNRAIIVKDGPWLYLTMPVMISKYE